MLETRTCGETRKQGSTTRPPHKLASSCVSKGHGSRLNTSNVCIDTESHFYNSGHDYDTDHILGGANADAYDDDNLGYFERYAH